MSYRSNRIVLCALAAAASLALATSAQAKLVGSAFDPPFFIGTGTFLLPDVPACLGLPGGYNTVNGGSDPCTGVLLLNAALDASDSGGTAHLSLPPPTPSATAVSALVIDTESPQLVVGVNTGLIPIAVGSCTGDLCGFSWWIQWDSGISGEGGQLNNSVTLWRFCFEGTGCGTLQTFATATNVTFFPAPEPGSLALIAGALGVGWVATRRRRTA